MAAFVVTAAWVSGWPACKGNAIIVSAEMEKKSKKYLSEKVQ
jgi:hypothetical protein